jgi:hypothetical protein
MTALARLKPEPATIDLDRLGGLVLAVQRRMGEPGVERFWDPAQEQWPEAVELARSIEHDEGWLLYATAKGEAWQRLFLYLDAPQVFLRSTIKEVKVWPHCVRWTLTLAALVDTAKRARAKRLGRDLPDYTDAVLTGLRQRRWDQWGRS